MGKLYANVRTLWLGGHPRQVVALWRGPIRIYASHLGFGFAKPYRYTPFPDVCRFPSLACLPRHLLGNVHALGIYTLVEPSPGWLVVDVFPVSFGIRVIAHVIRDYLSPRRGRSSPHLRHIVLLSG